MALVAYSDSEDSDASDSHETVRKPQSKLPPTNFSISKDNPKKIRVNLQETSIPNLNDADGARAAKRPRVGAGAFSGFNAMLPAPKRDNVPSKPANGSRPAARKVFSLKTGAEPAFSRESDAELRQLFAEQDEPDEQNIAIPESIPKASVTDTVQTTTGKPLMFKPLSVSRGAKKKKPSATTTQTSAAATIPQQTAQQTPGGTATELQPKPKQKISLFSAGTDDLPEPPDILDSDHQDQEEDEIVEVLPEDDHIRPVDRPNPNEPETLDALATSLNLTAAERRQLLGRNGASSSKIINFNTDTEYAANQAHIAAGEQVQHNPVRAIAPGKHSLKQLIGSAQGQKEALEESFAAGRRNKREAGSKYGW